MENFTIHDKIFEQRGHETFTVTRNVDGVKQRYMLKKIECGDENFANQAYRELLRQKEELEEISGIFPVKEFQIYWETKNSSMHICYIRDVYEQNLMAEVQKAHLTRSMVKEKFVEDYLCQMILVLEKCHKRNIFHRAIKLSNVVKDVKMKNINFVDFWIEGTTKFNKDSVWQPPELGMELQESVDNEKIDVWGVGAVMLCVVCALFVEPGEKFEEFLQNIKEDINLMDDTCKRLYGRYSHDIVDIIRSMLEPDPLKRPTIQTLKQESYLETVIKMNDTQEISKEFRKNRIVSFWPLPKSDSVEPITKYMKTFIDCEERVASALIALNKLFIYQNSLNVTTEDTEFVLTVLKNHLQMEKIHFNGFQLLLKLISKCSSDDYLFSCQAVCSVVSILKVIPKNYTLKPVLYEYISHLALSDSAAQSFGSHGGLHILITMLKEDKDDPFLLQKSCHALWGLCTQVCNAKIAVCEGIPADMCSCLKKYSKRPVIAKELIAVLFSLSPVSNMTHLYCKHNVVYMIVCFLKNNITNPEIIALCCNTLKSFLVHATFCDTVMIQFRKNNILYLLVSILWDNLQNPYVVNHCFSALEAIIVEDEESAYIYLVNNSKDAKKQSGMKLIRKVLNANKINADVARNVCKFLNVILKFEEGCLHAKTYNIPNWITVMKNTFRDDKEISCSCEKILKKLRKIGENL